DESASVIKEMSKWKKKGKCKQLLVAGCLPKYLENIDAETPHAASVREIDGIINSINLYDCGAPRIKATEPWYAYVKISEGCDNKCSYCLIPKIRGRLRHRKIQDILNEVKALAKKGVKEIIYIAQDTTAYPDLPGLLKLTAKIKGIHWIRIMYSNPAHLSDDIIEVMAKEKKIVKYIDLPIQHSENKILKLMGRKYDRNTIEIQLKFLRAKIPAIAIRTSVIVGFPGETKEDFERLKDFIKRAKFDRLGIFPYSREKGTTAYNMKEQIPDKIKKKRAAELMRIQSKISKRINQKLAGKTLEALIEDKKGNFFTARTYRDAPEIDGKTFVGSRKPLAAGCFYKTRISEADTHDLKGKC
ncbi:MAG: MiaB/RimO family radical SAM methylthiotransferase, partial [Candidatus Margulisiibacteriota bacterium]